MKRLIEQPKKYESWVAWPTAELKRRCGMIAGMIGFIGGSEEFWNEESATGFHIESAKTPLEFSLIPDDPRISFSTDDIKAMGSDIATFISNPEVKVVIDCTNLGFTTVAGTAHANGPLMVNTEDLTLFSGDKTFAVDVKDASTENFVKAMSQAGYEILRDDDEGYIYLVIPKTEIAATKVNVSWTPVTRVPLLLSLPVSQLVTL